MFRISMILVSCLSFLSACAPGAPQIGEDGNPLPQVYRINQLQKSRIQFRVLDGANALRQNAGLPALQLSAELNAAAATHSRDMSVQNRPWHFGSDGSSPVDRVQRAGYGLGLIGENISETYESELETLAAWMEDPATREIIMSPEATDLGLGWFQEPSGKIWWTLITGGGAPQPAATPPAEVVQG